MTKRLRASFQTNQIVIDLTEEYGDYTIVSNDRKIVITFTNRLNNLTHEILDEILSYLSIEAIVNLEQTSKEMQKSIKSICDTTHAFVVAIQKSMIYPKKTYDNWVHQEKFPTKSNGHIRFKGYVYPITLTLAGLKKQSYLDLIKINALISKVYRHLNELITNDQIFFNKKGEQVYYSEDGDKIHFDECDNLYAYKKGFKKWLKLHQYLKTLGLVEPGKLIDDDVYVL